MMMMMTMRSNNNTCMVVVVVRQQTQRHDRSVPLAAQWRLSLNGQGAASAAFCCCFVVFFCSRLALFCFVFRFWGGFWFSSFSSALVCVAAARHGRRSRLFPTFSPLFPSPYHFFRHTHTHTERVSLTHCCLEAHLRRRTTTTTTATTITR